MARLVHRWRHLTAASRRNRRASEPLVLLTRLICFPPRTHVISSRIIPLFRKKLNRKTMRYTRMFRLPLSVRTTSENIFHSWCEALQNQTAFPASFCLAFSRFCWLCRRNRFRRNNKKKKKKRIVPRPVSLLRRC